MSSIVLFRCFSFFLGLCIGSFLNVVIDRLYKNESIITGRSYCDSCKKQLKWYDMVPVVSFLFLKGKCRFCNARISIQYPAVELTTGILFAITAFFVINNFQSITNSLIINPLSLIILFYCLFMVSSLIVIFVTDLKYGIIPDKIAYPAIAISLVYLIINHQSSIINPLLSAFGSFLFFLALFFVTRGRGMGFGDVKLSFLMGLFLGFPKIITALYIAFLTGAIVSLILVLWGKKKLRGGTIAFGPFLVFGTLLAFFLGEKIGITGYINQLMALHW